MMKITYIEVEASNEDLRACKSLSENLCDTISNAFAKINTPVVNDNDEDLRGEDGNIKRTVR